MTLRWAGRVSYLLAVTLVVAGLTHLSTVLALPGRSSESAYASLAEGLNGRTLDTFISGPGFPFADPAFPGAACLYDLRHGPVSVSLEVGSDDFAVLSLHDRHGRVLAGLTSRSAPSGRLALTITAAGSGKAQRPDQAKAEPPADIRVEAADPDGFALAEVLARAPSEQARAQALASALSCRRAAP